MVKSGHRIQGFAKDCRQIWFPRIHPENGKPLPNYPLVLLKVDRINKFDKALLFPTAIGVVGVLQCSRKIKLRSRDFNAFPFFATGFATLAGLFKQSVDALGPLSAKLFTANMEEKVTVLFQIRQTLQLHVPPRPYGLFPFSIGLTSVLVLFELVSFHSQGIPVNRLYGVWWVVSRGVGFLLLNISSCPRSDSKSPCAQILR